jgi:translation elongation factor EF-G
MAEPRYEGRTRDIASPVPVAQSAGLYWETMDLFRKGMERTIESQRQWLEVVFQQNEEAARLCRSMFGSIPGAEPMFDFAQQTFDQFLHLQRKALELVGQQNTEMAESARKQGERAAHVVREAAESTGQRERKSA